MTTFLDNNDKINIDNSIAEVRDQFNIKSAEGTFPGTISFDLTATAAE